MAVSIKNAVHTVNLDVDLVRLINDPSTVKLVVSTDEAGRPHASRRDSLTVLEDGQLAYAEEFEGSHTNSNVLRAVWYDRTLGVTILAEDGRAFQILGRPVRFDFVGPLHKKFYLAHREKFGSDSEVSGVWTVKIDQILDDSPAFRRAHEDQVHPYFRHLDRSSVLKRVQA